MPDRGAPMAYKRMKAGEAGITGLVIGGNGAEMTPCWRNRRGLYSSCLARDTVWAGFMLKALSSLYLRQIRIRKSTPSDRCGGDYVRNALLTLKRITMDKILLEQDWKRFKNIINNHVSAFIEKLNGHYHEHTYAFYGNDGKNYPSYAELHWKDVSGKHTRKPTARWSANRGNILPGGQI
jgi:hypothetical protein